MKNYNFKQYRIAILSKGEEATYVIDHPIMKTILFLPYLIARYVFRHTIPDIDTRTNYKS